MHNDKTLDAIYARLDSIDTHFNNIDTRFDSIDAKFNQTDKKFNQIDKKLAEHDKEFVLVREDIHQLGLMMEHQNDKTDQILEIVQGLSNQMLSYK